MKKFSELLKGDTFSFKQYRNEFYIKIGDFSYRQIWLKNRRVFYGDRQTIDDVNKIVFTKKLI